MRSNYLGRITNAEKKARNREIHLQIADTMDNFGKYVEATVLWWLHTEKGRGKVGLERDLESLKTALSGLKAFYELGDVDEVNYACVENLKAIGFDISLLGGAIPIEYSITDVNEPLPNRAGCRERIEMLSVSEFLRMVENICCYEERLSYQTIKEGIERQIARKGGAK